MGARLPATRMVGCVPVEKWRSEPPSCATTLIYFLSDVAYSCVTPLLYLIKTSYLHSIHTPLLRACLKTSAAEACPLGSLSSSALLALPLGSSACETPQEDTPPCSGEAFSNMLYCFPTIFSATYPTTSEGIIVAFTR